MRVQSLGREDPLEEGMATHPSTLAWKIPWTEEPGGLQSMGSQRVRNDCSDLAHMSFIFLCLKQKNSFLDGSENAMRYYTKV